MYPDNICPTRHLSHKKTDYQPHEYDCAHDHDLLFYHVYDTLSPTPFIKGHGIHASASKVRKPYSQRITVASIAAHIDPPGFTPTPFISLFDDQEEAMAEGRRRIANPQVWNAVMARWEPRGQVKVAILSATGMAEAGVFYFSSRELVGRDMLNLRPMNRLRRAVKGGEWFAVDHIPESAMEGYLVLDEEEEDDEEAQLDETGQVYWSRGC